MKHLLTIPYVVQENADVYKCIGIDAGSLFETDGILDVYGNAKI